MEEIITELVEQGYLVCLRGNRRKADGLPDKEGWTVEIEGEWVPKTIGSGRTPWEALCDVAKGLEAKGKECDRHSAGIVIARALLPKE